MKKKPQTDCKMLLGGITERFGIGQVWEVWESGEKAGKPTQEMFSGLQTLAFKMITEGNWFFFFNKNSKSFFFFFFFLSPLKGAFPTVMCIHYSKRSLPWVGLPSPPPLRLLPLSRQRLLLTWARWEPGCWSSPPCAPSSTSSSGFGTRFWSASPSGTGHGRSLSFAAESDNDWSGIPSPAPESGSGCRSGALASYLDLKTGTHNTARS